MIGRLVAVGGAVAAGVLAVRRRWALVLVRGHSMEPTYRDGERVLVRYRTHRTAIGPGDVVVFWPSVRTGLTDDPPLRVKRVAAIAGDPVPEWLSGAGVDRVPDRHLVVNGDNPRSQDSRQLGFVPEGAVVGLARRRQRGVS